MDCSPPGSSVLGISRARVLECVAISSSRASSWPRDWTQVSCVSCIGRQVLYHWTSRENPGFLGWLLQSLCVRVLLSPMRPMSICGSVCHPWRCNLSSILRKPLFFSEGNLSHHSDASSLLRISAGSLPPIRMSSLLHDLPIPLILVVLKEGATQS